MDTLRLLDAACAFCGKSVVSDRGRVDVREGERLFHLDCYRLYKRQPPPTPVNGRLTAPMTVV
jgi:hypothetical protein